jgi:hypothetical protein
VVWDFISGGHFDGGVCNSYTLHRFTCKTYMPSALSSAAQLTEYIFFALCEIRRSRGGDYEPRSIRESGMAEPDKHLSPFLTCYIHSISLR